MLLLSPGDFFSKLNFFKMFFHNNYQNVKMVWILSVLIWVQTVCKGYQQLTKVAAESLPRVNSGVRNGRTTLKPKLKSKRKEILHLIPCSIQFWLGSSNHLFGGTFRQVFQPCQDFSVFWKTNETGIFLPL